MTKKLLMALAITFTASAAYADSGRTKLTITSGHQVDSVQVSRTAPLTANKVQPLSFSQTLKGLLFTARDRGIVSIENIANPLLPSSRIYVNFSEQVSIYRSGIMTTSFPSPKQWLRLSRNRLYGETNTRELDITINPAENAPAPGVIAMVTSEKGRITPRFESTGAAFKQLWNMVREGRGGASSDQDLPRPHIEEPPGFRPF